MGCAGVWGVVAGLRKRKLNGTADVIGYSTLMLQCSQQQKGEVARVILN